MDEMRTRERNGAPSMSKTFFLLAISKCGSGLQQSFFSTTKTAAIMASNGKKSINEDLCMFCLTFSLATPISESSLGAIYTDSILSTLIATDI